MNTTTTCDVLDPDAPVVYIDDMRALNGSCPDIPSGGVSLLAKGGSPLFRGIECRLDAE